MMLDYRIKRLEALAATALCAIITIAMYMVDWCVLGTIAAMATASAATVGVVYDIEYTALLKEEKAKEAMDEMP